MSAASMQAPSSQRIQLLLAATQYRIDPLDGDSL